MTKKKLLQSAFLMIGLLLTTTVVLADDPGIGGPGGLIPSGSPAGDGHPPQVVQVPLLMVALPYCLVRVLLML